MKNRPYWKVKQAQNIRKTPKYKGFRGVLDWSTLLRTPCIYIIYSNKSSTINQNSCVSATLRAGGGRGAPQEVEPGLRVAVLHQVAVDLVHLTRDTWHGRGHVTRDMGGDTWHWSPCAGPCPRRPPRAWTACRCAAVLGWGSWPKCWKTRVHFS